MTKELLAVLDMSKEEQWVFCAQNGKEAGESLADLAFRLMGENRKDARWLDAYDKALFQIFQRWFVKQDVTRQMIVSFRVWLVVYIEPIDRIIAALIVIAKENA